jgi:murein DD-endopeptidase MepM/ murein hydrolase activator NlpD
MRTFSWMIGGGALAAAAYYWRRDHDSSTLRADREPNAPAPLDRTSDAPTKDVAPKADPRSAQQPLPGRWVWPVGIWHDRKPEVSSGFSSKRRLHDGRTVTHGGVDIMYRRRDGDPWEPGTPNGTRDWVMPDRRAALAVSDGVVRSATKTPRGWAVVIDHAQRTLATFYTHLSSALVTAKQPVTAGTPLGVIGADPLDGEHLMHLHFEIWRGGADSRIDPQQLLETSWQYVADPGDRPALVARNGGHRPADGSDRSIPVIAHYRRPPRL